MLSSRRLCWGGYFVAHLDIDCLIDRLHRYIASLARFKVFIGLLLKGKSLLFLFETRLLLLLLLFLDHLEVGHVVQFRLGLLFLLHQHGTVLLELVVEGRLLAPHLDQLLKV